VLATVGTLTRETMETAVTLRVPLVVETGSGSTWMDAK
jgi:DNA polymerase I-like protein with 3'-5' exonuclease and polymerase domains